MTETNQKEKAISQFYAELNKLGQNGEYERAFKIANKIIGLSPHDSLAFQCKIVCLIQLNKFEDAIQLLNKKQEFASLLIFERAYCHYRINQHVEALKEIEKCDEDDNRIKELKAQILYRLESYEEAAKLYKEMVKTSNDDYDEERNSNLSAALLYSKESEVDIDDLRENTYELCFNKACLLISRELYVEAEKKLKQCEKLCREMLEEEEASEEEIDIELASIKIQLAFVYQKLGRLKEAQQLYSTNLKLKLEDIALTAVACNNIVCINKDQNLFDSKKKMKTALNDALKHKLPSESRKYIALNNALFTYYINQNEQCEKLCQQIDKQYPDLVLHTTILRSAVLFKLNKMQQAIDVLKSFKSTNEDEDFFVKLAIAQYYLVQGKRLEACEVMENMGENTYKPGIIGALTTIYLALGEENAALKLFEKSVTWYKKNRVKGDLTNMWRQAADFHIRNGHAQVAVNSLEELLRSNQGDKKILAQLILALSQFDEKRALVLSKDLPSVKELSEGLDMENIQNMQISSVNVKKSPSVTKQESQPGTPSDVSDDRKKKHRNKKKGKLPKNCDLSQAPDPERWLPKYERSGYRKKRDRRTKEVIKGSQGTASGQADQFDFSSKHVDQDYENSPAEPSPRGHLNHQKKQKKKNKRR
ncbi:signal recognition particle subunit SRP72 [Coccinella septempunctata]|uniref:signal recognition particle subunit SRP72 n=1 Tax=Coccinella septempunctata TaxID=41139 RepID=UPI001D08A9F5|nr:signal recognition particle subunit SRP72 [Coccinella septempunctata]